VLEIVRRILYRARDDWGWITQVPKIRMLKELIRRVRFLTDEEADRLMLAMPEPLAPVVLYVKREAHAESWLCLETLIEACPSRGVSLSRLAPHLGDLAGDERNQSARADGAGWLEVSSLIVNSLF